MNHDPNYPHQEIIPPDEYRGEPLHYQRTVIVREEGSILFPLITLGFYIVFFPLGVLLNIVGLVTGPQRGCFLVMLIFIMIPMFFIFMFVMSIMGLAPLLFSVF